jgi:hypothetical protein
MSVGLVSSPARASCRGSMLRLETSPLPEAALRGPGDHQPLVSLDETPGTKVPVALVIL